MPLEIDSEDVKAPDISKLPAPLRSVPMPKYVAVAVPPVAVGNCTNAVLEIV
jgi:hypothetical protein